MAARYVQDGVSEVLIEAVIGRLRWMRGTVTRPSGDSTGLIALGHVHEGASGPALNGATSRYIRCISSRITRRTPGFWSPGSSSPAARNTRRIRAFSSSSPTQKMHRRTAPSCVALVAGPGLCLNPGMGSRTVGATVLGNRDFGRSMPAPLRSQERVTQPLQLLDSFYGQWLVSVLLPTAGDSVCVCDGAALRHGSLRRVGGEPRYGDHRCPWEPLAA